MAGQPTCYNSWGGEEPNQQPCFAAGADTSATTWCCGKTDYCLSNGLCLRPGSSNLMTQQGCTDKNWGGSCKQFCPATSQQPKTPEIPLIPCPASLDAATSDIKFCCGPSAASCCQNSTSWLTIPASTLLLPESSTTSSSSSSNTNYSLKIGLGIGLGIGVPILLVLCAVAYLLAQPLHRRRRGHHSSSSVTTTTISEKHPDPTSPAGGATSPNPETEKKRRKKRRRRSFGQVDTSVAPDSDHDDGRWPHHHSRGGPAAAARWARSPFGFEERPVSVKEVDGQGVGGKGGVRGAVVELPTTAVGRRSEGGGGSSTGGGRERWNGRGVHVVSREEVELPTGGEEGDLERGLGNVI
ncbi:hypothetical protein C8A05DRAFT_31791 [Staphylotrichum tortipilum]|uniref:Uncharacterized protein n=1 Tax=Staphylotrichum tortipilum TaxID=2831512 RepID=A0AAN6MPE8_9PEZI|nr:hypothetical protein C8A05DRAFT_31791 [Staphylotrichum longicolle]